MHLTGEISARDRTEPYKGSNFGAYPGDIVFSKIDARNGAIGVLPPEIGKAVVTTEFPVFTPDPTRLDGEFVKLVLRTGGFLEALRRKASGTSGRKRITPDAFQNLRIPLPPLSEQQAMVAAYRAALDRAAALEAEATEADAKAAEAFETALGFPPPTPLPDRPVFVARFKHLDRWGHEPALRRTVTGAPITPKFPPRELGDLVNDVAVGWSPKCLERPKQGGEWGVLKLSAVTGGYLKPEENKALRPDLNPKPELEVMKGDVLITRGSGVTRLVGAATYVDTEPPTHLMICDLIFRVVFREESPIEPAFLAAILGTSELRSQIEGQRTGAAPMMQKITKTVLMGLTFPLPPVPEQKKMAKALSDARTKATGLRADAAAIRAQAWTDFEAAVYAAEDVEEAAKLVAAAI